MSHNNEEQKQIIMQQRKQIWGQVDKTLASLPYRTSVVLMGDLSLVLHPYGKVAGQGIHAGAQHLDQKQERADVLQMLERHRLAALNTWGKKQYTYKHPSGCSQIDYVMVRQPLADKQAKTCGTVRAPIAGWRSSGHEILVATIRQSWRPWQQQPMPRPSSRPHAPPVEVVAAQRRPELSLLQAAVKQHHDVLTPKPPKPPLQNLHHEVLQVWKTLARERFRVNRGKIGRLFGAWHLALLKRRAHREVRRLARARKRVQILQILEQAEEAAQSNSTRTHYQYVRMLAPKRQSGRIHLRDSDGNLISPEQECLGLKKYAQGSFTGPAFAPAEWEPLPSEWFAVDQWQWGFKQLVNHKAVPKDEASIVAWKQTAEQVSPILQQIASDTICSLTPRIPDHWAKVQLAWIPKPNKSPTSPANLRTIGLMGADTKAFLQILKHHADYYVQRELRGTPQYACRAKASTADALLRASMHCEEVRCLLETCRDDLTSRLTGQSESQVVGGLMASLDLSKAFDSITHREMYESLLETGMPPNLAGALLQIHVKTELSIVHKGYCHSVNMGRGLRQGCSVAPMIYAAWTCRLSRQLEQRHGAGWPQDHLSIYADGKHSFWKIRNAAELDKARVQLGNLIGLITSLGMQVNSSKSKVVIQLKGKSHQRHLKRCTKFWNGQQCLIVPCGDGTVYIPIQPHLEYLGVKLSYGRYEVQAAQHRVQQAQLVFTQLRAPLRTNGPLSQKHRLRLYKACVLPSMLYGLVSVGCTLEVVKLISQPHC